MMDLRGNRFIQIFITFTRHGNSCRHIHLNPKKIIFLDQRADNDVVDIELGFPFIISP